MDEAGTDASLLPEGRGRPFPFGPWVAIAARGKAAEPELPQRIEQIWKTDLFLSTAEDSRYFAATVKSNALALEAGRGLRIGIVPESARLGNRSGIYYDQSKSLWVVSLEDPNGFMGIYNDAYMAVGRAMCTLGKQQLPPYYTKPSVKGERLQLQLERYPDARILEVEDALNDASQQNLVTARKQLVGVNAPDWLHIKQRAPLVIAPKPKFERLT